MSGSLFQRLYSQSQSENGLNKRENYLIEIFSFCLQTDRSFLEAFFQYLGAENCEEFEIETQHRKKDYGIFDILIKGSDKFILLIECKVDSSAGKTQLYRYSQYLSSQKADKKILIYLTKNAEHIDNFPMNVEFKHIRWFEIYRLLQSNNIVTNEFKNYLIEQNMSNMTPFLMEEKNAIQNFKDFYEKTEDFFEKLKEVLRNMGVSKLRRDTEMIKDAYIGRKIKLGDFPVWLGFYHCHSNDELQLGISIDGLPVKSKAVIKFDKQFDDNGWDSYTDDDEKFKTYHKNKNISEFFISGQFDNELALNFLKEEVKGLMLMQKEALPV